MRVAAAAMSEKQSAAKGSSPTVPAKKPRKPYTKTKPRVSWTPKEHARFLKALELYNRDWKRIEEYVGTKTVIQIRSHAQKHFLKVLKNGTGEHLPPPRRKATNKAPALKAEKTEVAKGNAADAQAMQLVNGTSDGSLTVQAQGRSQESPPDEHGMSTNMSAPDFKAVYSFLSDLFQVKQTASSSTQAQEVLEGMKPVDRETTVLLMKNIRNNLCSRQMWQQQADLVAEGCVTFLDPQDALSMHTKSPPSHSVQKDVSGEGGSGEGSNEALEMNNL